MKLSDFKQQLAVAKNLDFFQPNGRLIPAHFHVTEVGLSSKHFIDCGGKIHVEKAANIQFWVDDNDLDHRLRPLRFLQIIDLASPVLGDEDLEVEVEFQTETLGKYLLDWADGRFLLLPKQTDCLAKDTCMIPKTTQKAGFFELNTVCTPGGGCC
jgi:Family of unknown function (DUF6428)